MKKIILMTLSVCFAISTTAMACPTGVKAVKVSDDPRKVKAGALDVDKPVTAPGVEIAPTPKKP